MLKQRKTEMIFTDENDWATFEDYWVIADITKTPALILTWSSLIMFCKYIRNKQNYSIPPQYVL